MLGLVALLFFAPPVYEQASRAELLEATTTGDPDAWLSLGLLVAHDDGLAAARPDLERALALGDTPLRRRLAAEAFLDGGDAETALGLLTAADGLSLALRGQALLALGRTAEAERALLDASALAPVSGAFHDLGELYLALGRSTEAMTAFSRDLIVDPSCRDSRLNLAGVALEAGDAATAAEHYRQSLALHPADARALSGLGRAELALGDPELAAGFLRQALALDPDDPAARRALTRARLRLAAPIGAGCAVVIAVAIWLARRRRPAASSRS